MLFTGIQTNNFKAVYFYTVYTNRAGEVTLRRARLVLGWVTVFGRVRHLGV